jgi:hypothetical protein
MIYIEDLTRISGFNARPGLCRTGGRAWFARHGLNWNEFRHSGIAEEQLLAIGDAFALAVVEQTRAHRALLEGSSNGR